MFNPWLSLAYDAARLGLEAQWVIAARMMRLVAGGALAENEVQRMVSEKTAAFVEAQMVTVCALGSIRKRRTAAKKVLGVYRKRVRQNSRRLRRRRRG
jgi:hypothetical protein